MSFSLRRPWVPKRLTRTSGRRAARPRVELLEDRRLPSTLLVMNPNDSGAGSLRQAISDANAGDAITFAAGLAPIQLTTGQLLITKDLTIAGNGPGATVVDGTFSDRVFEIQSPLGQAPVTVTISGVTIQHGSADVGGGVLVEGGGSGTPIVKLTNDVVSGNSASGPGGGIAAQASGGGGGLTLLDTTVDGNTAGASGGGGDGGGIYDIGVALTVDSSTVSNNDAKGGFSGGGAGGGIWVGATAATITNSTLSDNRADLSPSGGGSGQGGGLFVGPNGNARLTNDTLADNLAMTPSGGGQGGGIYNASLGSDSPTFTPAVTLQNTIVAGSESGGGDFAGPGTWDDLGNNLGSDGTGDKILTLPSDLNGVDPRLGPLQNNGGPTLTRALLPGSPAIDAGADGVASTDQRGLPRPGGAHTDIGAFEVQPAAAAVPGPAAANAPAVSLGSSSVVEGTRHFALTVTGTNLTFTSASVVLVDGVALRARWLDGTHLQVRNICERLERLVFGRPHHATRHREGFDEGLLTIAVFTPGVGVSPSQTFRVLEAVAPGDAGTPLERFAAEQFEALTGQEADQSPVFQAILHALLSRT